MFIKKCKESEKFQGILISCLFKIRALVIKITRPYLTEKNSKDIF